MLTDDGCDISGKQRRSWRQVDPAAALYPNSANCREFSLVLMAGRWAGAVDCVANVANLCRSSDNTAKGNGIRLALGADGAAWFVNCSRKAFFSRF